MRMFGRKTILHLMQEQHEETEANLLNAYAELEKQRAYVELYELRKARLEQSIREWKRPENEEQRQAHAARRAPVRESFGSSGTTALDPGRVAGARANAAF